MSSSGDPSGPSISIGSIVSSGLAIAVVVAALAVPIGAFLAYEQVGEGYVGVQTEWGAVTGTTYDPGANWVVPVMQDVQYIEVRPRTYTMADATGEGQKAARNDAIEVTTLNGTTVRVDVTVRYRVDPDRSPEFVEQWNTLPQVEERLIRPTVRSTIRDEGAGIPTSEIYTSAGRQRLGRVAQTALESEFDDEALVLEAVQIRNVNLPQEYQAALDRKEIEKQQVQQKQYEIEQEKKEAERKRIEARSDAEVIRIRGEALRENPVILQQQYIQQLDEGDTVYVPIGQDSGMPMFLEVTRQQGDGGANASASANTTVTSDVGG